MEAAGWSQLNAMAPNYKKRHQLSYVQPSLNTTEISQFSFNVFMNFRKEHSKTMFISAVCAR